MDEQPIGYCEHCHRPLSKLDSLLASKELLELGASLKADDPQAWAIKPGDHVMLNFRFATAGLAAACVLVILAGCDTRSGMQATSQPSPPAPPPPPRAPSSVMPATGATGIRSQAEVEQFIREDLDLTTMTLKSKGNGGYTGTGTDANGLVYTIVVKQVPGGIKVDWTTSSGNGQTTFGNPVP